MRTKIKKNTAINSIFIFAIALSTFVWFDSAGNPIYWQRMPDGQALYLASKWFGLTGFSILWIHTLLSFTRAYPNRTSHIRIGVLVFVSLILHGLLFVAAVSIREGSIKLGLFLPSLTSGYYKFFLGLGVIAFWLLMLAVAGGASRHILSSYKNKNLTALRLHQSVLLVITLGSVHAIAIGSESRTNTLLLVYGLSLIILIYICYKKISSKLTP